MTDRSLPRQERLRSFGAIRRLFESGESGFVYPLRYVWIAEADEIPSVEVLFSVPKKFEKPATKRNLQRRGKSRRTGSRPDLFIQRAHPLPGHRTCRTENHGTNYGEALGGSARCR